MLDKVCRRCKQIKPVSAFYKQRLVCKQCHNNMTVQWQQKNPDKIAKIRKRTYRKNRIKRIADSKKGYQVRRDKWLSLLHQEKRDYCWRCGYNKAISAIEQHHMDSDKKDIAIAFFYRQGFTSKNIEAFNAELIKTISLCANCHKELHAGLWDISEISNGGEAKWIKFG